VKLNLCSITLESTGRECPEVVHPDSPIQLCWRHLAKATEFLLDVTAPAGGPERAIVRRICPDCDSFTVTSVAGINECWCYRCRKQWRPEQCEVSRPVARSVGAVVTTAEKHARAWGYKHRSHVVYFIRFGDRIKIGTSQDFYTRLNSIPHDEILAVLPGDREVEQQLHRRFAEHRIKGEWFTDCPDIRTFIDAAMRNQRTLQRHSRKAG
jgi:hypothetical protein